MSIGSVIRAERLRLNFTQTDLAEILEVTAGAVSHWESDRSTPRDEMFNLIAAVFEVDVDYLKSGGSTSRVVDFTNSESDHIDTHIARIVGLVARNNNIEPQRVYVEVKILPQR